MFSLKKLFSKEDRFFTLLQASAEEGRASVRALSRLLANPADTAVLQEFRELRDKERRIAEEIERLLCQSYATPLEREDIELLARALNRVAKTVKKFAERYLLCAPRIRAASFARQVEMLGAATEAVCQVVADLRKGPNIATTKAHHDVLQKIEGEADKLMVAELEKLYQGNEETVIVVILKDLFELLEKVFDRCRDAGNIVFQIVLKNS